MKKNIILLFSTIIFLSFAGRTHAQKKRMMLFDKYSDAKVLMKNSATTSAKLNYDTANKNMMYLQGNQEMILTNNNQVDTIYISNRKFIPLHTIYLEVIELKNEPIFIDWLIKNKYRGNRGAYGQITQNKVETINTALWTNDAYKVQSAEVFELENANQYWFYLNDNVVKCKNEKDLLKLFPQKKEKIKAFIKEQKVNFKRVPEALKLIDFCLQ